MLCYVYVSTMCPHRFRRLRCRLFHKAEIVAVEPPHPLPLPMAVPGSISGRQCQYVTHFDVHANPRQSHLPRPSPPSSSSVSFSCRRLRCWAPRAHNRRCCHICWCPPLPLPCQVMSLVRPFDWWRRPPHCAGTRQSAALPSFRYWQEWWQRQHQSWSFHDRHHQGHHQCASKISSHPLCWYNDCCNCRNCSDSVQWRDDWLWPTTYLLWHLSLSPAPPTINHNRE